MASSTASMKALLVEFDTIVYENFGPPESHLHEIKGPRCGYSISPARLNWTASIQPSQVSGSHQQQESRDERNADQE
jgi:hypothetical protein